MIINKVGFYFKSGAGIVLCSQVYWVHYFFFMRRACNRLLLLLVTMGLFRGKSVSRLSSYLNA